jgi:glycosyltransferase involved in cell wall biosynthesis
MQSDLHPHGLPYQAFLSLCLPAFNEKDNIEDTLDAACTILPLFVRRFEIVVIDDGSSDGTGTLVARYAERDRRVRLITHPVNRGYGAAVSAGLRAATGDVVAFTDSDGQFSMLDLPMLLAQIEHHDAVVGYRHRRADSRLRLVNAWGWNRLVRAVLGVRIRDLDCAFKLFRRDVIDRLQLTATGAAINAEILVQCSRGGVRIVEMPVHHFPRRSGTPTGAALRVIARAFRELPLLLHYRFRSTPMIPRSDAVVPAPSIVKVAAVPEPPLVAK